MTASLALDVLVAILLVATVGACVALNRRLGTLRRSHRELARLAEAFNEATARAESGISGLKAAGEKGGKALGELLDRGRELRDDLVFLVDRGERLAARLEEAVGRAVTAERPPGAKGCGSGAGAAGPRSRGERALVDALRSPR